MSGTEIYTGTPYFNAMGAWESGVDLLHLIGHPRAMNAVANKSAECITHPLKGELNLLDVPYILELATAADAVLMGGGLTRNKSTHQVILQLIRSIKKPMVLDAEAIRALKGRAAVLKGKTVLLTPHMEEFHMLTGETVENSVKDRSEKVKRWAKKLGVTVLLKGHVDVISDGKVVHLNKTGTPYMSKGGTGDVLAGLCVGFLAQGVPPMETAEKAAYLNGKAGEKAYKKYGSGFRVEKMFPCRM